MTTATAYWQMRKWQWQAMLEGLAQASSLLLILWLAFQSPAATNYPLLALAFLPALWAALRHGFVGAGIALVVVNALILFGLLWSSTLATQWLALLPILFVCSSATLLLGFTVSQKRRDQSDLSMVRAESNRLKTMLNASPVLIAYIDADERYQFHNQFYYPWLNISAEDISGKRIVDVIGEPAYQAVKDEIRRALSGQMVTTRTVNYQDTDKRWVDVTYTPDKNTDGEINGFISFVRDVTKEKLIEQELNDVIELNQKILEATAVGFLVFTLEGDCVVINESAAQIVGAPNAQAMYRNLFQIRSWQEYGVLEMINQVLATGVSQRQDFHLVSTFGKDIWIDCQAGLLTANAKRHLLVVIDDISERIAAEQELARHRERLAELVQERTADLQATNSQLQQAMTERERAEVALRHSEEHFRLLAENAQDVIFRFDLQPEPHIAYISPSVYLLTGFTPEEHYANPLLSLNLMDAEDRQQLRLAVVDPSKFRNRFELRWQRKDGSHIWAEQRQVPIFNDEGQCVSIVGIIRDITERHQTDEQLRKLSRAVEQSSVSITITDPEGTIEYVNPRFTQVTGFSFENVRGQKPRILNPENKHRIESQQLWHTLQTGVEWRGELQNMTKTGSPYWESGSITPILDNQGEITHFLAVMEDITQRKQQEREREAILSVALALRAAQESEAMLALIMQEITKTLDAVKVFFIVPDPANGEMVIEAIYEEGEFKPHVGVRIPAGKGIAARVYLTGRPYVSDDALVDPKFATPDLLDDARAVACVPLIAQSRTIGLFSVARKAPMTKNDVELLVAIADMAATGLQRAAYHEETLRHAANLEREVAEQTRELRQANERLHELDRLKSKFVSDVSHELRTPVTNMGLYLKLIRRKPEKQEQYLDILQEEADRLETLVLDILDLAQLDNKPTMALSPININELLANVVMAHQAQAESRHLELSLHPDDNLPIIMGDSKKLIQVATNLVANALNYTASGYVRIRTYAQDEQTLSFSVEDSGIGIYPEDQLHLFQRFYRGKRDQIADVSGTGLGLSIVKELVDLHSGSIAIASEVGKGSTFVITLPVALSVGK